MSDERVMMDGRADHADGGLRESEARFRQFGEHASDALWIIDARSHRLEYLSPAFERIWGEERGPLMADLSRWRDLVHPDDREAAGAALPRLLNGEPVTAEYRITRADGTVRWIRDVGFAIRDDAGTIVRVAGIAHDFTDQCAIEQALRDSEQRQRTLLQELQHRVRNNLATIRSVARRTAEASETAEEFAAHLDGRLGALARAQAAATRDLARGMDLRELVDDELIAVAAGHDQHVHVDGPGLRLRSKVGETLTLAVHELVTNSVKFGALADGGELSIIWRVDGPALTLTWAERMFHMERSRSTHRGFGTELLEQTLPYELGAEVSLDVQPSDVRCVIRLPYGYAADL